MTAACVAIVLLIQVSDRQYFGMYSSWTQHIQDAQEMVTQGRGEEIVCRLVSLD